MTINTNQYCRVNLPERNMVQEGPRTLPATYQNQYNFNNDNYTDDTKRRTFGWYPYNENDNGPPQDGKKYNRSLSEFSINVNDVTRDAIYTEWTQQEYDLDADTTLADSQRIAQDLAAQTERILQQNTHRNDIGKKPLIPAADLVDVNLYLGDLYDAMDNPAVAVKQPPGATRQITEVFGENESRATVRRSIVNFGGFDYTRLTYTLYPEEQDPTGMSFKVHLIDGTFLGTFNLTDQGDGSWMAETSLVGALRSETADLAYELWKGEAISQRRDFLHTDEDHIFDVRWLNGAELQRMLGQR